MSPCLVGMEACVGAHHLSHRLQSQGHDARLMPAKYVRPYSKGQKNDFRDAETIAEAVQHPTMKFVATKTANSICKRYTGCVSGWSAQRLITFTWRRGRFGVTIERLDPTAARRGELLFEFCDFYLRGLCVFLRIAAVRLSAVRCKA